LCGQHLKSLVQVIGQSLNHGIIIEVNNQNVAAKNITEASQMKIAVMKGAIMIMDKQ
jgi:hypothetical protein